MRALVVGSGVYASLDPALVIPVKVYTRKGDDGTTGLLYGGRVAKDSPVIEANGAVDEAQAALGMVRAEVERRSELDALLVRVEYELYVLMADLATGETNRAKLTPGVSLVTADMVTALEPVIDQLTGRFPPLKDFVIPGHDRVSAALDVARTAIRRAERLVIGAALVDSSAGAYLNRLSDLVWVMARWQEHGDALLSRQAGTQTPQAGTTWNDG
ncbi:MAG: cob(I)yrinic acid a,c-diamide adenosyltransferase [Actinomycetota bacterium]|nr:cob(I)yrinic acid a,c-diamide adenosyltransferase [Actinomycetota bacterium]